MVAQPIEHSGLTRIYHRFSISLRLNDWIGDVVLLYGPPSRFWKRTRHETHPFHRCELLARFGEELSRGLKRHLRRRHNAVCSALIFRDAQLAPFPMFSADSDLERMLRWDILQGVTGFVRKGRVNAAGSKREAQFA